MYWTTFKQFTYKHITKLYIKLLNHYWDEEGYGGIPRSKFT